MSVATKQAKAPYDHPNFLVVRDHYSPGLSNMATPEYMTAAAANTAYVGTTLRSYTKALVVGATVIVHSGGSAAATNSIDISRNAATNMQVFTFATSAGASALNDVHDFSLSSGFTLTSAGDFAVIHGGAASTDKMIVIKDVIWRYRILPSNLDASDSAA